MDNKQGNFQSGLLLAIIGTALFSIKSIFIKLAYQEGVDTTTLLSLRMLIALPFYLLILIWLLRKPETKKPLPKEFLAIFGLGFIGYYLSSYLDLAGLNYISAQLERLTLYTYPIMTALLSWLFLREVITKRLMFALVLTYTGVLLLYFHESMLTGINASIGVLLVAAAALSMSFYLVLSKKIITKFGSRLFTSIAMLSSTVFVLIHFLLTNEIENLLINNSAWVYVFMLAIFSTVLPSFMVSEAIARIGAAKTTIVGTVGPIFTVVLAVFLLGEPFGWIHLAGVLLVIFGVSLLGKK
ncbi:DMT family transporter [Candidatus Marithrix sp. Canyon 246]|uniref:DMT family transporter n=1 Tax=Candidatus Marithrix sp. Canyon 246 TaxID=1827136 RepID=UPI000849F91A|nr:DMT family transporter [Candidatus Marithrix sp. Canyon 246]